MHGVITHQVCLLPLCYIHFCFAFPFRQVRVLWYMLTTMLQDEEEGRNGLLAVAYNIKGDDDASSFNSRVSWTLTKTWGVIPIRPAAIHFCYNNALLWPVLSCFQRVIGTYGRVRFRSHFGSHAECQFALLSFGILSGSLPVDTEGNMTCSNWNQWIEKRKFLEIERGLSQLEYELSLIRKKIAYDKAKFLWPRSVTDPVFCLGFLRAADFNPRKAARLLLESLPDVHAGVGKLVDMMLWLEKRKEELDVVVDGNASSLILFPSSNDILLGSGFAAQNFPGNMYFISVVQLYEESYNDAGSDNPKKTEISKQVLKIVQESGARFLQRAADGNEEDGWVHILDDQAARKKVSHAFRNLRRRMVSPTTGTGTVEEESH
jgi:hypothetical protein